MPATVVSPVWVWRDDHRVDRDRRYSTLVCARGERISRALALSLGLLDDPPAPRASDVSFFVLPAPKRPHSYGSAPEIVAHFGPADLRKRGGLTTKV